MNSKLNAEFEVWDKPTRLTQISAVTFLTAALYVVYSLLSKSWVPEPIQSLMFNIHIYINVPALLFISFLAYKKHFYCFTMYLLAIYPIISLTSHSYLASLFNSYTPFLVEGYLGVLWIFVVSGLTFRLAFVSAALGAAVVIISASFYINEPDEYLIHVFWVFCSFSFGFLGSLIFERSRKTIFVTQRELKAMAITDALTGIFNRNKMNEVLPKEIVRALRYNKKFGLLMIDIDHFKRINDVHGHDVGDQVLKKVATLLASSMRDNDILVRWGGEEFVVIALEMDEHNLVKFSQKLKQKIEHEQFDVAGSVTISLGATLVKANDTQHSMLMRADKALYEAKQAGRNTLKLAL